MMASMERLCKESYVDAIEAHMQLAHTVMMQHHEEATRTSMFAAVKHTATLHSFGGEIIVSLTFNSAFRKPGFTTEDKSRLQNGTKVAVTYNS